MNCVNCGADLPPTARFCLNCGAAQPVINSNGNKISAPLTDRQNQAEAETQNPLDLPLLNKNNDFDWLAREAELDPSFDYSAQRRYSGAAGRTFGCLSYVFFVVVGLLAIIPGVPILAIFGLPAAIILGVLTFFNIARLQERWRKIGFLKQIPGLNSANGTILSMSVTFYLAVLSGLSILLLAITTRR